MLIIDLVVAVNNFIELSKELEAIYQAPFIFSSVLITVTVIIAVFIYKFITKIMEAQYGGTIKILESTLKAEEKEDKRKAEKIAELEEQLQRKLNAAMPSLQPKIEVGEGKYFETSSAAKINVAKSMSNKATPEETFLEYLRLVNLNHPCEPMSALFDKAQITIDAAGERIGWDVLIVTQSNLVDLEDNLRLFAKETARIRKDNQIGRLHYLALVASGENAAEGETLANKLTEQCEAINPKLEIPVFIGFMAYRRFVDLVVMWI
jgi:hypothetical protein